MMSDEGASLSDNHSTTNVKSKKKNRKNFKSNIEFTQFAAKIQNSVVLTVFQ